MCAKSYKNASKCTYTILLDAKLKLQQPNQTQKMSLIKSLEGKERDKELCNQFGSSIDMFRL